MDIHLPNGERKTLRCRFSRIKIKESDAVFVTLHDVVEPNYRNNLSRPISILWRRYAEEYADVFQKKYDFLMMVDEFYILTNIGRKFTKITGYRRSEYIGRRFDTLPGIDPYVELVQALQNCKAGYGSGRVARTIQVKMTSRQGDTLKFSITLTPIFFRGVRPGVWKLSSLQLLLLLLDRYGWQRQIWFLGSACYLLMLVLSLRLLGLLRTGGENRISRLCFYLGAGTAALLVLLQLAGAAELHDVLVGYGFFMAVLHLVSLLGEKPNRQELLWLLPTFLALGLDLLILLQPNSSIRNAPFFLSWILLNLFIRGFGLIRTAIRREQLLRLREEELREAKVRVMINQIQPHFIYNTLVSVYVLCEDDPRRAMEVVKNFTAFLQANFTAITAQELIAFPEELEHTRAYLGVEQVLLEDRLQVAYDTPFTAFRLPPMTLQPVVENAVRYGVKGRKEPGRITIRSFSAEDAAVVTVEDDGPGFDPDTLDGSGHVGLQNVRERLRMMCGGTLDIRSAPGLGTTVSIRIPNGREEQT